ncbi:MAG: zinc-binding dehydrogenase [Rubrobacter sp.]|nr:zinc-binding dehydrogenase [Rubrobacter sp.]
MRRGSGRAGPASPWGAAHDQGLTEAWSTISSLPPGATADAAARRTSTRGNSIGECRYWAETRSKAPGTHLREDLNQVFGLLADGTLTPNVAARYPLTEASAAKALAESRTVYGKVILVP